MGEITSGSPKDITNGHFIHAGPLEGIGVSISLWGKSVSWSRTLIISIKLTRASSSRDDKHNKATLIIPVIEGVRIVRVQK